MRSIEVAAKPDYIDEHVRLGRLFSLQRMYGPSKPFFHFFRLGGARWEW